MLAHFLPATRADASDLMGMQRLSILHAALHPNDETAEPANSARCADSQSVNQQMLAHFLPPAYPRSRAMSEHGAPAPYPITGQGGEDKRASLRGQHPIGGIVKFVKPARDTPE